MTAAIMAAMLSNLPYLEVDTTEHAQEWNFVAHGEEEMREKCLISA